MRILSLFSGIGAFEKALTNLGIDYTLVGFSEIDKYAVKSYCAIHNVKEELNIGDICKVDETTIEDFELMTYGFPCQSFSVQGNREGFEDETRGNLFFESMRIAAHKKPKFLIAENVKGLVGHNKGKTFETVLKTLDDIGYRNYYAVLNSSDFDSPQHRERIFVVSIRKDLDIKFEMPVGQRTTKIVEDILDQDNNNRYLKESLKPFADERFHREYSSNNGIIKVFDGNVQGFFKSDFSGKRLYSIKGLSPTLTTKKETVSFYEIVSELNSLERFRLQGFSDVDHANASKVVGEPRLKIQAGNSICVNVVEAILKNLLKGDGNE